MYSGAALAFPAFVVDSQDKAQSTGTTNCPVTAETMVLENALAEALSALESEQAGVKLHERLHEVGELLTTLAERHVKRGETARAEVLYLRAIQVFCAVLAPEHPLIALSRDNLAGLYKARRQYVLAESLQRMALADLRRHYKDEAHIDVAVTMCNLADTCMITGRLEDARNLIEGGINMMRKLFGPHDRRVQELIAHYRTALERAGK